LNDAYQAYDNILKEMRYNRVDKTRIAKIEDNIITRLEQIVVQDPRIPNSGSLPRAVDAFQRAYQLVEEETNAKRDPDVEGHRLNMNEAHRQMGILSNDIKLLLDAMSEGIVESQLIALIASIEQKQREHSRDLHNIKLKAELDLIEALMKGKDKKEEKKDDKKEEKKPVSCESLQSRSGLRMVDHSLREWRTSRATNWTQMPAFCIAAIPSYCHPTCGKFRGRCLP
jgi:hypothetical protein